MSRRKGATGGAALCPRHYVLLYILTSELKELLEEPTSSMEVHHRNKGLQDVGLLERTDGMDV